MNPRNYTISTILYGLVAMFGAATTVLSVLRENWILLIVSLLIIFVAVDNFFCGTRARASGFHVKGHYTIPHFLKPRK